MIFHIGDLRVSISCLCAADINFVAEQLLITDSKSLLEELKILYSISISRRLSTVIVMSIGSNFSTALFVCTFILYLLCLSAVSELLLIMPITANAIIPAPITIPHPKTWLDAM